MASVHVIATATVFLVAAASRADIIYESATMGEPGQTWFTLISEDQFLGSRFTLSETTQVTAVGGHLLTVEGTIFGAIVDMDGRLPAGSPFDDMEVLANTRPFAVGLLSTDVRTVLDVTLPPGDYSLIFGSGLFGANGLGGMPHDNMNTPEGMDSYFFWDGDDGLWSENTSRNEPRFVVEGFVVPSPASAALMGIGLLGFARRRRS